jgi:hypothetical protein
MQSICTNLAIEAEEALSFQGRMTLEVLPFPRVLGF